MHKIEELNNVLSILQASSSDAEACAMVSEDGPIMASEIANA